MLGQSVQITDPSSSFDGLIGTIIATDNFPYMAFVCVKFWMSRIKAEVWFFGDELELLS